MDSTEKTNEPDKKKPVESSDGNLKQTVRNLIDQSLQGVRDDIQDLQLMIRGIHAEIQEIKRVTQGLGRSFKRFVDGKEIKKPYYSDVGEIATGLDLVTKIPQHLRRTFEVVLQLNEATAREVAIKTRKSRPLESDYLNQLTDRKFLKKKHKGKQVIFFYQHGKEEEELNNITPNGSVDFVMNKKIVVNNANNSHKKKLGIKTYSVED